MRLSEAGMDQEPALSETRALRFHLNRLMTTFEPDHRLQFSSPGIHQSVRRVSRTDQTVKSCLLQSFFAAYRRVRAKPGVIFKYDLPDCSQCGRARAFQSIGLRAFGIYFQQRHRPAARTPNDLISNQLTARGRGQHRSQAERRYIR